MLNKRLASAAVIVSALLLLIWLDYFLGRPEGMNRPGVILCVITSLAITCAAGELAWMWRKAEQPINITAVVSMTAWSSLCSGLAIFFPEGFWGLSFSLFDAWASGLMVVLGVFVVLEMRSFGNRAWQVDRLGRHLLAVVYLSLPAAFAIAHRSWQSDNGQGLGAFLAVVVTVKLSDVGAYFSGKTWGRHKMAPRLSPNKTWEGVLGGLAGGVVGSSLIWWLIGPWLLTDRFALGWMPVVIYGIVIALAGMLGDLSESLMKRDLHAKDSSVWLPGLGGVLDIVDSLVFALPVSYLILHFLPGQNL